LKHGMPIKLAIPKRDYPYSIATYVCRLF
jgi:hypothetical protein